MVQVLASRQLAHTAVAIASTLVRGALDLAQVGDLMEGGGGLILGMALAAQAGQRAEVQRAVDHEARAGEGVGENTRRASIVDVRAVVAGIAGGGGAALVSDAGENAGDGGAGGRGRGLEVLGHLGGGTGRGDLAGAGGERAAVGHGSAGGGAAGAGAVGLNDGALLVEDAAGLGSSGAIDGSGHNVRRVGEGALELSRVDVGVLQDAGNLDVEGAALGEVVDLGRVPGGLDGLAGGDQLEGILGERRSGDAETETVEGDGAGWRVLVCCVVCCVLWGAKTGEWGLHDAKTVD